MKTTNTTTNKAMYNDYCEAMKQVENYKYYDYCEDFHQSSMQEEMYYYACDKAKELKDVKVVMPKWLEFNAETLTGKILDLPERDDIDLDIKENLIVEYYSR